MVKQGHLDVPVIGSQGDCVTSVQELIQQASQIPPLRPLSHLVVHSRRPELHAELFI